MILRWDLALSDQVGLAEAYEHPLAGCAEGCREGLGCSQVWAGGIDHAQDDGIRQLGVRFQDTAGDGFGGWRMLLDARKVYQMHGCAPGVLPLQCWLQPWEVVHSASGLHDQLLS